MLVPSLENKKEKEKKYTNSNLCCLYTYLSIVKLSMTSELKKILSPAPFLPISSSHSGQFSKTVSHNLSFFKVNMSVIICEALGSTPSIHS